MKVISRCIIIEDEKFVLIYDERFDEDYRYQTISYDDIDEHGKLKRGLDGFDLCVADSIEHAIERRTNSIHIRKWGAEKFLASKYGEEQARQLIKATEEFFEKKNGGC